MRLQEVIEDILPRDILQALEMACQLVENDAVANCPVADDGLLRASINHKVEQDGFDFLGAIGSNAEHAPYVHEGTGLYAIAGNGRKEVPWTYRDIHGVFHSTEGQHPNQFLQKSLDANMQTVRDCFEGVLEE